MKNVALLLTLFATIFFTGCFKTKVSDEIINKLPVCVETSNNMFTMSRGSIREVGSYYKSMLGDEAYNMYPIKEGKQLIFKIRGETAMMNVQYKELEKGACMEIIKVKVVDGNGKTTLEATPESNYAKLAGIAEYIFKF